MRLLLFSRLLLIPDSLKPDPAVELFCSPQTSGSSAPAGWGGPRTMSPSPQIYSRADSPTNRSSSLWEHSRVPSWRAGDGLKQSPGGLWLLVPLLQVQGGNWTKELEIGDGIVQNRAGEAGRGLRQLRTNQNLAEKGEEREKWGTGK